MNKLKKSLGSIMVYGIVVIILIFIIGVMSIFAGAIMKLFGFQYNSIKDIIIFFMIQAIIGFPFEIFAKAIPKALLSLDKITVRCYKIIFIILDTMSTMFIMSLVDYFMTSVSVSDISIAVISIIIAVLSSIDFDK